MSSSSNIQYECYECPFYRSSLESRQYTSICKIDQTTDRKLGKWIVRICGLLGVALRVEFWAVEGYSLEFT